ncbi:DMT family transporter [Kitasatospora sp. NBC_01250]|uniref:DMT family transporter n=1 Tax=unclassified Kitasatospora TaxID=2633591 RepID=UPI002E0DCE99|nr:MULTISPECIES: DMT family transporter [unclassified Kitasatospora]WSJ68378.1 DMT family transporter [Kitasatospora sp. NBC_01302]
MAKAIPALRGSVCAAGAMVAAGSSAAVSPLVVNYPWFAGQFWRYLVAALALLPLCRRGAWPRLGGRGWGRVLLLVATGNVGFNLCLLQAVRRADPTAVGAAVGAAPVLLALLGPLLGPLLGAAGGRRRPSPRILTAALLAFAGLLVARSAAVATGAGLCWALGALVCETCFSLLAVELVDRLGAARLSAVVCLGAALAFGTGALLTERQQVLRLPTGTELAAFGYLALVVTSLAFFLWYRAVGGLGVARAGLFVGLLPLGALLTGPLLGTGRLTAAGALGALLVAGAVLWGVTAPGPDTP